MPLFKTIEHTFSNGKSAKVFVWKITETLQEFLQDISLKPLSTTRLQSMKSELHQRGFLSIRHLLATVNLSDKNLFYDEKGKPFLNNGMHISISHSFQFSTIVISNVNTGIDIEQIRTKIEKIATKFCLSEFVFLNKNSQNYHSKLTSIWAVKEAIFKIENEKGISFKDHINVYDFDGNNIHAILNFNNKSTIFEMQNVEIENFILVFGIKISE